ncbi:MAG: hypothetical protein KAK04_23030 [Cyclobacteriaceae bacterium]|nr:hypothetical protein [Cyclobacteriaceae bacterium]
MTDNLKNTFLILLSTIICSCTSYVPVQKTLPPEIVLPEQTAEFLFIDRFEPDDLDFNNENKIEVYEIGLESFIAGLEAGFDTSRYFHLTLSDTLMPSHSAHEPAYNLSQDVVQILCREYNQNYLLTLDNYDLFFDQEVEVVEEDGSKSKTAYYDLVLNTYITIYSAKGQIVEKMQDELRILHDKRGVLSGLLAIGPSMGKADKNVLLISDELGRKFIQKFYPLTVSELREFYATKEFTKAFKAFQMQDWRTVEEELMILTKSPDPKIEGRAAYNLTVLYENLNRTSEMEFWYRRAVEKLGSKIPSNTVGY